MTAGKPPGKQPPGKDALPARPLPGCQPGNGRLKRGRANGPGFVPACPQAGQDGGDQLTGLMAVHGLLVQVTEHDGVPGYLGRPGDRDGRGGGLERVGIAVKDPESGGGDRAAGRWPG